MGKKSGKTNTTVNAFGNDVDYFLFSTRTKDSIFTLAEQLADYCGCHFNLMPTLKIPDCDMCHMLPEFRMMYAQYNPPVMDTTFAQEKSTQTSLCGRSRGFPLPFPHNVMPTRILPRARCIAR